MGRLPDGARNPRFTDQLREAGVSEEQTVVFLCRSGQRSIGAAEAATADGVQKAYNIAEGFEGGLDAGGPPRRRRVEGRRPALASVVIPTWRNCPTTSPPTPSGCVAV